MIVVNHAKEPEKKKLCLEDMITGIGRKATDEELLDYLLKEINVIPIGLESAFAKYLD
jgi:hypothetical protein